MTERNRTTVRPARAAGTLLALALAAAALPAGAYDERFRYCFLCHGAEAQGNPAIQAPRIAGLSEAYLERQLLGFKQGWRGHHPRDLTGQEMWPMAAALSRSDIADAAAYFSAWPEQSHPPSLEGGDPQAGAARYATCAACHGAAGEGNDQLGAPELAGQADWYLVSALQGYRAGWRGSHPDSPYGGQMKAAVSVLASDQDVLDVVAYINTLGPATPTADDD
jgi:cytochrome c oxidase subunit 2